jgi:hypothetical protein
MRRTKWYSAAPFVFLTVLASCRDGLVTQSGSPTFAAPAVAPASMKLAPQGRPSLSLSGGLPDSTSGDFYVGPNGGVFYLGNHAVVFPAGSVCDPATSTYGRGTWDDACSPISKSLVVHAEVRRKDGVTSIDFSPALRFVPSSSPSNWVWLVMYSPDAKGATGDLSQFNIFYTPAVGAAPIDETTSDATLRTYVDNFSGISLRRIKHFSMYESGYGLGSGRSCDPAVEECPN